ncbi:hypothetical protein POJ06DRAFT_260521 [Lipomyces tetrasporus]|uniref:Uncharacterized protein n=1 Tax=Lipomyces tetrasporus TaxID=54092 RepID=A0AAD7VQB3_9ASCO|nr:uncharacterized protein POJ06DRAFT_260521 [Lipomyces tetrasporus]KAJ8097943.1 hypothetical protein POJ06DRAFT_260521 [Lipomyces tetrasporus]
MRTIGSELRDRQTGDFSVYSYYLRAAGWLNCLFFLIYVSILAFCFNFPSEFHLSMLKSPTCQSDLFSSMVAVVL